MFQILKQLQYNIVCASCRSCSKKLRQGVLEHENHKSLWCGIYHNSSAKMQQEKCFKDETGSLVTMGSDPACSKSSNKYTTPFSPSLPSNQSSSKPISLQSLSSSLSSSALSEDCSSYQSSSTSVSTVSHSLALPPTISSSHLDASISSHQLTSFYPSFCPLPIPAHPTSKSPEIHRVAKSVLSNIQLSLISSCSHQSQPSLPPGTFPPEQPLPPGISPIKPPPPPGILHPEPPGISPIKPPPPSGILHPEPPGISPIKPPPPPGILHPEPPGIFHLKQTLLAAIFPHKQTLSPGISPPKPPGIYPSKPNEPDRFLFQPRIPTSDLPNRSSFEALFLPGFIPPPPGFPPIYSSIFSIQPPLPLDFHQNQPPLPPNSPPIQPPLPPDSPPILPPLPLDSPPLQPPLPPNSPPIQPPLPPDSPPIQPPLPACSPPIQPPPPNYPPPLPSPPPASALPKPGKHLLSPQQQYPQLPINGFLPLPLLPKIHPTLSNPSKTLSSADSTFNPRVDNMTNTTRRHRQTTILNKYVTSQPAAAHQKRSFNTPGRYLIPPRVFGPIRSHYAHTRKRTSTPELVNLSDDEEEVVCLNYENSNIKSVKTTVDLDSNAKNSSRSIISDETQPEHEEILRLETNNENVNTKSVETTVDSKAKNSPKGIISDETQPEHEEILCLETNNENVSTKSVKTTVDGKVKNSSKGIVSDETQPEHEEILSLETHNENVSTKSVETTVDSKAKDSSRSLISDETQHIDLNSVPLPKTTCSNNTENSILSSLPVNYSPPPLIMVVQRPSLTNSPPTSTSIMNLAATTCFVTNVPLVIPARSVATITTCSESTIELLQKTSDKSHRQFSMELSNKHLSLLNSPSEVFFQDDCSLKMVVSVQQPTADSLALCLPICPTIQTNIETCSPSSVTTATMNESVKSDQFDTVIKENVRPGKMKSPTITRRTDDHNLRKVQNDSLKIKKIEKLKPVEQKSSYGIFAKDQQSKKVILERRSNIDLNMEMDPIDHKCSSHLIQRENTKQLETISVHDDILMRLSNILNDEFLLIREQLDELRQWEGTGFEKECSGRHKVSDVIFTLLCYNVLAQQLLNDNMFLYRECDPEYLDWKYRWPLLQYEIEKLSPDILTLQEVQNSHYIDCYQPWLNSAGYEGVYKKRTGGKSDGCAIFFRTSKFNLLESVSVEYYQPNTFLDRDNVGLVCNLRCLENNAQLCVATTHLLFNPRRHDIKLAQLQMFFSEIERISYTGVNSEGQFQYCPSIITGDFNLVPNSTIMHFLKRGELRYQGLYSKTLTMSGGGRRLDCKLVPEALGVLDTCQHLGVMNLRRRMGGRYELPLEEHRKLELSQMCLHHSDREETNLMNEEQHLRLGGSLHNDGIMQHFLNLRSVFKHSLDRLGGAPEITSMADKDHTVDYILYSQVYSRTMQRCVEGRLKLLQRYGLLSAPEGQKFGPAPSAVLPSDHFPLAAKFLLREER